MGFHVLNLRAALNYVIDVACNCDCVYTALCWSTLVPLSVGVVIAYAANHNMSLHIKSTRRLINTNIRDLKTFANNTPSVSQASHTASSRSSRTKTL